MQDNLDNFDQIDNPHQTIASNKGESLTSREQSVAELIVKGLSRKQMANELVVSEFTVKNHIANILKKKDCANQKEYIIKYAKGEV